MKDRPRLPAHHRIVPSVIRGPTLSLDGEKGHEARGHTVEHVDMWQNVSGRQEVRYNSRTDAVPPREYEQVAKSVGLPLATVTVNRHGRVIKRDSTHPQFNAGLGELTIPVPDQPVKVGAKWNVPDEISIRLEDGRVQRVKTRQLYTLDKVETGVATISVKTEVLTPVNDPKVHSQLVQRLTNGALKFDLEAGRLISKQLDLDETVYPLDHPSQSQVPYRIQFRHHSSDHSRHWIIGRLSTQNPINEDSHVRTVPP